MNIPEYMWIHSKYSSSQIRKLYRTDNIISNDGYVYVETNKVVYELKQSDIIYYLQLVKYMDRHGYYTIPCTTGMRAHFTLATKFCLCIDDFE